MNKIIGLLAPALAIRSSFYKISPAVPSVDTALAGFAKVKSDLAKAKQHHDSEAERHTKAIAAAEVGKSLAEAEATRAARALAKVEDFLV